MKTMSRHRLILTDICDKVFTINNPVTEKDIDEFALNLSVMPIDELRVFVRLWHDKINPVQRDYYQSDAMMQTLYRTIDTMISFREARRLKSQDFDTRIRTARKAIRQVMNTHQAIIELGRERMADKKYFESVATKSGEKVNAILRELGLNMSEFIAELLNYRDIEKRHNCYYAAFEYKYVVRILAGLPNVNWNKETVWQDFAK
jgi:hypothetical protein